MKTLTNQTLTIRVSPHGAELCSLVCNGKEYLWQADPAYWKRHSPVLFPIVGRVWDDRYRVEGREYSLPQHGFARDMEFTLVSESADEVRYRLTDTEETLKKYPYHFALEIGYRIEGKQVTVMWQVENTGDEVMHFQIGAHPAFYYPGFDAANAERGYFRFDRDDALECVCVSEKGCVDVQKRRTLTLEEGLLPLDVHTFDNDALVLEQGQVKEVTLCDGEKRPCLSMRFAAPVVGLWSPPGKNAPFVCIEPWYGRCDRAHYEGEYKDKDWMQQLDPHEQFRAAYVIEVKE